MRSRSDLRPYQNGVLKFVLDTPRCALFLDMGMGKTVVTLTAIDELIFEHMTVEKVLIIAPKRVAESVWAQEVQEWDHLKHLKVAIVTGNEAKRKTALREKAHIYCISRDNVPWLCAQYGGSHLDFQMIVLDESSSFKNHASVRFESLRMATVDTPRILELTGTPSPNGYIDLWAPIYLLDRGMRLGKNITAYRSAYFYRIGQHNQARFSASENARKEIEQRISDIVISMSSDDYIQLPDLIEKEVVIPMSTQLKKTYKEFEREKVLELFDEETVVTAANAAALTGKLQQFANGAVYDSEKNWHEIHNLKIEALEDIVEAAQGKPVIVGVAFRSDIERLMKHFKNLNPRQIKSDKDVVDWNAGRIQMLIMHPASGGHGLNLQFGGHYLVWFGHTFNLESYLQLRKRIHRSGQKHTCFEYKLVLEGSMDEDIIRSNKGKDREQRGLMDAVKMRLRKYLKK